MDCPDEKCQERLMELVACSRTKVTVRQALAAASAVVGLLLIITVFIGNRYCESEMLKDKRITSNHDATQALGADMAHIKDDISKLQNGQEEIKKRQDEIKKRQEILQENQMTPYQFRAIVEDALKKVKGNK